MYDTVRRDYYLPNVAQDAYHTVNDCQSFCKEWGNVEAPMLSETSSWIRAPEVGSVGHLSTISYNYERKSIRCRHHRQVLQTDKSHPDRTHHNQNRSVHISARLDYRKRNSNLSFNGQLHTVYKQAFSMLFTYLNTKQMTTNACYHSTNEQVERYNKTISTRLCQYVAHHQRY